jgi:hypothetical protein
MKTKYLLYCALAVAVSLPFDSMADSSNAPVRTVKWYELHKDVRLKVVELCNDNPGELGNTPNCINATRANGATSWNNIKGYAKNGYSQKDTVTNSKGKRIKLVTFTDTDIHRVR